jgi:beta-glucanase (GH16 family)
VFSMDGVVYATRTKQDLPDGTSWVYDHPFFILLNLAVGGLWPGNPDPSTVFPQQMLVDYVRVYEPNSNAFPLDRSPQPFLG